MFSIFEARRSTLGRSCAQTRRSRRGGYAVRPWSLLLATAVALAAAGCGGGGGTGGSPAGPGAISGRVITSNGLTSSASSQGLSVSLDGAKNSAPVQSDGSFSLAGVPPGSYTLSVRNGDGSLAGHAVVNVSAGMSTPTILELLPSGQVSGIVSQRNSAGTLDPVSGLTVTLTSASVEEHPIPVFEPSTNPTGPNGVIEGATATTDVLYLSPGSASAFAPVNGIPPPPSNGSQPTSGGSGSLPGGLPPPPSPPPAETMPLTLTTTTASNGTYSFTGVPSGLYTVSATQGSLSASVFVSVAPAQTAPGDMTLMLPPSTTPTQVSGEVTSAGPFPGGQPIAGALIQFETTPGCASGGVGGGIAVRSRQAAPAMPTCIGPPLPLAEPVDGASANGAPALAPFGVLTDMTGHYSWSVPPGITTLVASAQGFLPAKATVTPDASGKAVVSFQLEVDPAASLKASLTVDGFGTNPVTVAPGTPLSMTLTLSNPGTTPVNVTLSGVGEDLLILDKNRIDGLVWSLNYGKLQPDLAAVKTIPPGNSLIAHLTWPGVGNDGLPLQPGGYVIEGSLGGVTAPPVVFMISGTPSTIPPTPPGQPSTPPPTIAPTPPSSGAVGSGAGGTGSSGPGMTTSS